MTRSLALALLGLAVCATPAPAGFPETPPNDPLFDASPLPNATNEQWDLASPAGGFDRGISVDRAWRVTLGEGVTIAVIDVGTDPNHPDLRGRLEAGYDFFARDPDARSDTRNSHGTQVAGVLGAATDNGIGIAGIAPRAPDPADPHRRQHPAPVGAGRRGDRLRRRSRRATSSA